MSRPSDIFATSEILHEVIYQINDIKTLARCARVCRVWHSEVIPRLWKGSQFTNSSWRSPGLKHLLELAKSPENFRYHVQFIDKLVLKDEQNEFRQQRSIPIFEPELWSTFKGSEVTVEYNATPDYCLKVFIHPGLKSLLLCKHTCSNELLDSIRNKCPSLEVLKISLSHESSVVESLQSLAQSSLRCLEIKDQNANAGTLKQYTTDVVALRQLLKSPTLQYLALPINYGDLTSIHFDDLTSNLRCLKLGSYIQQCGNIFQFLPNLESFSVTAHGAAIDLDTEIFQPITACSKLRELEVLATYSTCELGALIRFAHGCPLIHTIHLHIYTSTTSSNLPYQISAMEIAQATELWPHLYYLGLKMPVETLDADSFMRIGRNCPRLTHMAISAELEIDAFQDEHVLYPQLEYFNMRLISVKEDDFRSRTESDLMSQPLRHIHRCMPRLKLLENIVFEFRPEQGRRRRIGHNQSCQPIVPSNEIRYKGPSVRRDIELGL